MTRTITGYGAYNFRDKDPAIDGLRTKLEQENGHRLCSADLKKIEQDGGPKSGTTRNWFFGSVLRPQNPSLEAAGRSQGFKRVWVRDVKVIPTETSVKRFNKAQLGSKGKRKHKGK
jgi:hypothetical protein